MEKIKMIEPECQCGKCGWAGFWDDADRQEAYEPYGEAFGSAAYRVEVVYLCPVCGREVEEAG